MNPEEAEFLEGNEVIQRYITENDNIGIDTSTSSSISSSLYVVDKILYWKRTEQISDLNLMISTVAYGGTKHAGRKLYESSLILGEWLREKALHDHTFFKNKFIIELGCGSTGIPGLVSLASGASHVLFCDHDSHALTELSTNIDLNMEMILDSRKDLGIDSVAPFFSFHEGDWSSLDAISSDSPLLLASEIVYDAITILPLIHCLHRLIAKSGSLLFCQSQLGRGNLDEFFRIMTTEPYCFQFDSISVEKRDPLDQFIFGIFHK